MGDKQADGGVYGGCRDGGGSGIGTDELGDDQVVCLERDRVSDAGKKREREEGNVRTLATASTLPDTVRTRSCTPGMTLLTPALTPVCSLRSATFFPAFPMMTPASFVLTRARRVRVSLGAGEGERDRGGDSEKKMKNEWKKKGQRD